MFQYLKFTISFIALLGILTPDIGSARLPTDPDADHSMRRKISNKIGRPATNKDIANYINAITERKSRGIIRPTLKTSTATQALRALALKKKLADLALQRKKLAQVRSRVFLARRLGRPISDSDFAYYEKAIKQKKSWATIRSVLKPKVLSKNVKINNTKKSSSHLELQRRRLAQARLKANLTRRLGKRITDKDLAYYEKAIKQKKSWGTIRSAIRTASAPRTLKVIRSRDSQAHRWLNKRKLTTTHLDSAKLLPLSTPLTSKKVDLRSLMPAVYDQGNLGSCTANAVAGLVHYLFGKEYGSISNPGVFQPSRLQIYYGERALEGTIGTDSGAAVADGIKVVFKTGVCREALHPYNVKQFTKAPSVAALKDAALHKGIIDSVAYQKNKLLPTAPIPQTATALETVLSNGYPVTLGMKVYDSFMYVGSDGKVPMPNLTTESLQGGHAILIVGYDKDPRSPTYQHFIVRNSWGTSWGNKGYCYIPYKYVLNSNLAYAEDFWTIFKVAQGGTLPSPTAKVAAPKPKYKYPVRPSKGRSSHQTLLKQAPHISMATKGAVKLPAIIDWRSKSPTIYDQKKLGSCTANALAGAVEMLQMKKNPKVHFPPSRLFLYYNERGIEGTLDKDSGAFISDGVLSLFSQGCCHESLWPYTDATSGQRTYLTKPSTAAYVDALKYKLSSFAWTNPLWVGGMPDISTLKQQIANQNPIVFGTNVYNSFESNSVLKTGFVPVPNTSTESLLGGHALVIVGYNDSLKSPDKRYTGHFIVRNSWGTSVGDKGYFYLPYAYFTTTDQGWPIVYDLYALSATA
jgi:C1A family cysteine protease